MPFSVVIKPEISSRPIPPGISVLSGARTIPNVPRKKAQSVREDALSWRGEDHDQTAPIQGFLAAFAQIALPGFWVRGGWIPLRQMLADLLFITLNFAAIRSEGGASILEPTLLYGALVILLGHSEGLYGNKVGRKPAEETLALVRTVVWTTLLAGASMLASRWESTQVAALVTGAVLNFLAMLGWREWRRHAIARGTLRGPAARNVLIVGAGPVGHKLAAFFRQHPGAGRVVKGFLDDDEPLGGEIHGRIADLDRIARAEFVDELILTIPPQLELTRSAVREARHLGLDVRMVPEFFGYEAHAGTLEAFGDVPVLTLHEEQIPAFGLFLKRVTDVAVSGAGLVAAAPMLGVIALAIKLDSRGPVFYRAARVGRKGQRFICYKLRTMDADAEKWKQHLRAWNQRQGPFFKLADDPRITRVGRFLRRYSLDELPQLWNVLRGDMSLVGPRPHPLDDFEHYELEHLRRLEVTPGMTGLWQVTARRDPSFQRNMALDLEYIEHWNLWMDVRILCKTIPVVLQGSGA